MPSPIVLRAAGPMGAYDVETRQTGTLLGTVERRTSFGLVGWLALTPDRTVVPGPFDRNRHRTRADAVAALLAHVEASDA